MLCIHTVLFPTDDSPAAEAARAVAQRFADRQGARLHVLRVEQIVPLGAMKAAADPDLVKAGVTEARRRSPNVSDAVLEYAADIAADVIVMGTHGRTGWDRVSLGSTAEAVLRRAPCPVLTVGREADADATGPVLVPVAFDSASDAALDLATAVAHSAGSSVVALHVVEPVTIPAPYGFSFDPLTNRELTDRVEETLTRWIGSALDLSVPAVTRVRHGGAPHEIIEEATQSGAGLIVQASHGRRGVSRWILGSVAEAVIRSAPCPVLTLRVGARSPARLGAPSDLQPVAFDRWPDLLDDLSNRASETPHRVTVEVVSPDVEGTVFQDARLVGITYDPSDDAVDVMVEGGRHHLARPFAVRALEAGPADPVVLFLVLEDGSRQRITVARDAAEAP